MFRVLKITVFVSILAFISLAVLIGGEELYINFSKHVDRREVKIIFGGDLMFDRHIRSKAEEGDYNSIFDDLREYLLSADVVLANLEGPITEATSVSQGSKIGSPENYTFTFSPEIIDVLEESNIRLVNLGNNHILNFGDWGLNQTKEFLKYSSIKYFGILGREGHFYKKNGLNIYFINYNEFQNIISRDDILKEVSEANEAFDFVVVYTHWGDEYKEEPREDIREFAHKLVLVGADLIIGSHPHVIGEIEYFEDVPIYYSLGNFVFDQYWEESVRKGLLVEVSFKKKGLSVIKETKIENKLDGRVYLSKNSLAE